MIVLIGRNSWMKSPADARSVRAAIRSEVDAGTLLTLMREEGMDPRAVGPSAPVTVHSINVMCAPNDPPPPPKRDSFDFMALWISLGTIGGAAILIGSTSFAVVKFAQYRAHVKRGDARRARLARKARNEVNMLEAGSASAPPPPPEDPEELAVKEQVLKTKRVQYEGSGGNMLALQAPPSDFGGSRTSSLTLMTKHARMYVKQYTVDDMRPGTPAPVPAVAEKH